ncbi:unnamed protein product [Penicillium camemberti]|uniref:Str. FM013 n=1 Tax=Penicillium camemberti (strain FM 013) TaxID=1429867 RepID=A0A0G4PKD2_PENC3|nr:unnamed protein product [Penicillium camemberti]
MFERAGDLMPEVPKEDMTKAKVSRQARRGLNKRIRRTASTITTTTATITTNNLTIMSSHQTVEEPISANESASTNQPPTRRKQRRSDVKNFRRMFERTGAPAAAAATITTTSTTTASTTAAVTSPPTPEQESRVMAGSPRSKKDGDKPLDFTQPLTFRPKKGTAVVESPSETLSLTLRPKQDRA